MKVRRVYAMLDGVSDARERGQYLSGISAFASNAGWDFILLSEFFFETEPGLVRDLERRRFDGVLAHVDAGRQSLLRSVSRPIVNFNSDPPHVLQPSVVLDNIEVGRLGASHLIDSGATAFAFCGTDAEWSALREAGFAEKLKSAGYDYERVSAPGFTGRGGELLRGDVIDRWLQTRSAPVAVMACNDGIAAQVIERAKDRGLSIPRDVSVLGVDNDVTQCELLPVTLSSIDLNQVGRGHAAAALLDRLCDGQEAPTVPMVFPPRRVVARRSTEIVVTGLTALSKAVEYIKKNACDGIDVADVARTVGVSEMKLFHLFRERLGRSPGEEIRRLRFQRAEELLLKERLSIAQVAARSGFSSAAYLSAAFKERHGVSPRRFRQLRGERATRT